MKINLIQYLFAYDVPGKLCYAGFPIAVALYSFNTAKVSFNMLADLRTLGLMFLLLISSILMGLLIGALFICFILSPLYRAIERMNGGPFNPGDKVYVICGPHKGRILDVYSHWQGLAVRIALGEEAKKNFNDVCFSLRLLKTNHAESAR
jgi:hypothetical protein